MVRAFVALELSDEIRHRLSEAQGLLKRCSARMTWVDPKNIHITIKFLGEVSDTKMSDVKTALSSVVFKPFSISTGTMTVNNPRRPFTVWCEIEDGGRGSDLQHQVEEVLFSLGFLREKRKFTPHATVARVKRFDPTLMEALKSLRDRTYGVCIVSGLKLKKSTLAPQGPVYEDLLEVAW
jgi:2'-5' RNA ligase